jgi:uncharacterized protein YndB with AHSA1/START domain
MAELKITAPAGKQVVMVTRVLNASPERVFMLVTDPSKVPEWWGPRRFSTTVEKMTVMHGGNYRFLQRDAEGKEYAFHGIYHDVVTPQRLVYTMEYEGASGHVTLNIDTFENLDGKTIMESKTIFESVEDRDQMIQWGMEEGVTETTFRLNELLAKDNTQIREENIMTHHQEHAENGKSLKIVRVFNAPIERVWKRWTDPDEFMCWWGPKDFTAPYAKLDIRPGGKYLSSMRDPSGKEYWSTGIYREIIEPNRLVYTDSFADEHGNIVDASYYGMGENIPREMEVEIEFEDIGGKTRMTLEHCGLPEGEDQKNAKEGWNQSFDKLEECLG